MLPPPAFLLIMPDPWRDTRAHRTRQPHGPAPRGGLHNTCDSTASNSSENTPGCSLLLQSICGHGRCRARPSYWRIQPSYA